MLSGKPSVLFRLQLVQICGDSCTHQHMVPMVARTFAVVPLLPMMQLHWCRLRCTIVLLGMPGFLDSVCFSGSEDVI